MGYETLHSSGPSGLPKLTGPRSDAERQITIQIDKGKELLVLQINTQDDLDNARTNRSKWNSYNLSLLKKLFTNFEVSEEYDEFASGTIRIGATLIESVGSYREGVKENITRLESIKERLHLYEEASQSPPTVQKQKEITASNKVFIVHGKDERAKYKMARFLERLGLEPIILHEKANEGQTLIEKFERHSSVAYAVILLTPDDVGGLKADQQELSPRARQNVVLELGFFLGKLGRGNVCPLYVESVELPSDYDGVVYIPFDDKDAWQTKLARELKTAGLNIDTKEVFGF